MSWRRKEGGGKLKGRESPVPKGTPHPAEENLNGGPAVPGLERPGVIFGGWESHKRGAAKIFYLLVRTENTPESFENFRPDFGRTDRH